MSYSKVTATVLLHPGPKARKISVPEMCLELQQKAFFELGRLSSSSSSLFVPENQI